MVAFISGLQWVATRVEEPAFKTLMFSGFDDGSTFHANPHCPKILGRSRPRTECFNVLKDESFCIECSRVFLQDRKLWKIVSEASFLRHYWNLRDYSKVSYQQLGNSEKLAISERKSSLEDDLLFTQKENEDQPFMLEAYFEATVKRLERNVRILASWESSELQKDTVLSEFKISPSRDQCWWIGSVFRGQWEDYRLFALAKAFTILVSGNVCLIQAPLEACKLLSLRNAVPLEEGVSSEILETAVQLAETGGVYTNTASVLAAAKQLV